MLTTGGARSKYSSSQAQTSSTVKIQTQSGVGVTARVDNPGEAGVQVAEEGVQTSVPPVDNSGKKVTSA